MGGGKTWPASLFYFPHTLAASRCFLIHGIRYCAHLCPAIFVSASGDVGIDLSGQRVNQSWRHVFVVQLVRP